MSHKPKSNKPYCRLTLITPAMAAGFLDEANTHNRSPKSRQIDILAGEIRAGRWRPVPYQGIGFAANGTLLDGQNRLFAIVRADRPAEMYVWFNCDAKDQEVTDRGVQRSTVDILNLRGDMGRVSTNEMAALRAMVAGLDAPRYSLSPHDEGLLLKRYRDGVRFALEHLHHKMRGVSSSTTMAVVARAYYSVDRDALARFCDVLMNGSGARGDEIIRALWVFLVQKPGNTREIRQERYGKTERSLRAWLDGEKLARLYAATTELFPLPGEKKANGKHRAAAGG